MAVLRTEFEQKFTEVLASRAVAVLRSTMGALDPHPERRLEQDGRSPPGPHRRDLSPGTEPLSRRPSRPRQDLELNHIAQRSRGTKSANRRTENGPSQLPVDAIRGGEDYASAIVHGSYRSVCPRCSRGSPGVDQAPPEQFSAENAARLVPPLARPGKLRSGVPARSTSRSIPVPALCRPPTSHWRAGARVDVGRPHQRLDQPLRGNSPTPGLALRLLWCGGAGSRPYLSPLSTHNRATTARGTLWSITCHQDYLSGEDRIPCPPKTLAVAPTP